MTDASTRLARYRLIESLVLLASGPEEQLANLAEAGGFPVEELNLQYSDWDGQRPLLTQRGALSGGAVEALSAVDTALAVISADLYTADAVRESATWKSVRSAARSALDAFANMGIPIPTLADADYNVPRTDAP